ncbi:MAG TPA: prepilin-type N-terminal cleavage/methylation domain-containing protein [Nitrospiria bacterium]|nr:prepilin-type N-terminal cleavage/methylation domain-containing protein [Nitrospiria bacterium]
MDKNRRQFDRGFTLLELLIAIVILAIGLLAVASMQANAIRSNSLAERVTVITAVAHGAIEDLLARADSDPIFDAAASNVPYDTRIVQGVTYNASYTMTPNTPVTGVAQVVMTVTGGGRTMTLTSYKRSL